MIPLYAIGDIHGHLDKLQEALALIEAEGGKDARVVFVGDYVDDLVPTDVIAKLEATGMFTQ